VDPATELLLLALDQAHGLHPGGQIMLIKRLGAL